MAGCCGIWGEWSLAYKLIYGRLPHYEPCCQAHDQAYVEQAMTRREADEQFKACLERAGAHPDEIKAMVGFVRKLGGIPWQWRKLRKFLGRGG